MSIHEGIMFDCNHYDYRANQQYSITTCIKSVPEEVRYDYYQDNLTAHIRLIHKEVNPDCNQCEYRST